MRFWPQVRETASVDLKLERRLGETIRLTLPFALSALLVLPLALGTQLAAARVIGPAFFWVIGILFGLQVALRQSANDTQERRDMERLLGLDPAARFLGRTISGGLLLTGLLVVLFVAMVVLYSPRLARDAWLVMLLCVTLFAIGVTEISTLAGEVARGLRNRAAVASLLIVPLSLPLVIGASQALAALSGGTGILPWILLLIGTDLALGVIGVGLAKPLEDVIG
jgi:heme exporter protein B